MNITVLNNKYKSVNVKVVSAINDATLMRFLETKNVTHYELGNNKVLITPNTDNNLNSGFAHVDFKDRIVYNNAIVYHKTNNNYIDSFGNIIWVDDSIIKTKEKDRLNQLRQYEAQV